MITIVFTYLLSKFLLHRLFETNKLLDLLLKDTLHELNIPLSVVKANTQMLKIRIKNDKDLNKLQRIDKACDELYKLYEDVDYYIKKQSKKDVKELCSLDIILRDEVDKFKYMYKNTYIVLSSTNLQINTDKRAFQKVVTNLISNALKYNKNDNQIEIYNKDTVLFIQDYGIGMSESELFLVFNRYYQSQSEKQGYGIGLDIVKTFCDENRVFINIESKKDIGTKISLDLSNLL
jgi:signal transduction histidine kinase